MGKTWKRGLALVLVAGIALVGAGAARAGEKTITDGKDTAGKLDIRSATHGHKGKRAVTHRITTHGKWSKSVVGARTANSFGLSISTKRNGATTHVVIVFASGERMRAVVIRPNGRFVGRASASKPNARTVRIVIPRKRLGNPGYYRWKVFSYFEAPGRCARGCSDLAPNRARLVVHDLTPPKIRFPAITPGTFGYGVEFTVRDKGGSRIKGWRLERRTFGEEAWSVEKSGNGVGGPKAHAHDANPGDSDEWRVIAFDREGNQSVSPIRLVTMPEEDRLLAHSRAPRGMSAM